MTGTINMSALGKHLSDQTLEIENLKEEIVRLKQQLLVARSEGLDEAIEVVAFHGGTVHLEAHIRALKD